MPYVLEYTSRHYQRRTARRRAAAAFCAGFAAAAAGFVAFVASSVGNPTFSEIVNSGYTVKKTGERVEAYQMTANKALLLKEKWDAAAARQAEFMPYLRLVWSEVPVTNLVAAVAEALRVRPVNLLRPVGFSVRMEDASGDWTDLKGDYVRKLVASLRFLTDDGHDEDMAAEACASLSNLFASVSIPGVGTNATVRKFSFPAGNRAGLEVTAEYAFPTVRSMPVSRKLDEVVKKIAAFQKEMAEEQSKWKNASGAKGNVDVQWNLLLSGRYPWQRGLQRKLVSSPNFLNPARLQKFVSSLPTASKLDEVKREFEIRANGLTNALDNALFSEYDVNQWDPAEIHVTKNLLEKAWGSIAVPTNRILRTAMAEEALTLRHPRRKSVGGVRLADPFRTEVANHYAFAQWRYSYASTNSPVRLTDLSEGLAGYSGSGHGYEPESVEATLGPDGKISKLTVGGLVPVRLMHED